MTPDALQAMLSSIPPLLPALIPVLLGILAWRRGQPGAGTLAAVMWALALWSAAHILGPEMRGPSRDILSGVEYLALLVASPLWFAFALAYTGRGRWLTLPRVASLALLTVAVYAATGVLPGGSVTYPGWLPEAAGVWVDLAYRGILVLAGSAILVPILAGSQWIYRAQSLCLLIGFLIPWTLATAGEVWGAPADTVTMALAFTVTGLVLVVAFAWLRLLDLYPVAHDAVVEGMSDGTVVLDHRNRVLDLNPAARRILGGAASGAIGRDFRKVLAAAGASPLEGDRGSALLRRFEEHGRANEEIELGEDGDRRHYDVSLSALSGTGLRRAGRLVVLHEATERKIAAQRLDRMAHYDDLTGLPNRTSFHEHLSQEIARNRRSRSLLALFFLDLDRFKAINDSLGHETGDLLLCETAKRLSSCVRDYDVVSRLAGDEFTIILPGIAEAGDATPVAERIIEEISRPFRLGENEVLVTTSVGVCFYPADGTDPATLLKNADTAMYRAKAAGKNRYELFVEDALARAGDRLELDRDLLRALDNGELILHYQPEIRADVGGLSGVEALMRWEHPSRGIMLPGQFLPAAEENGLIFALERWALREACRQMRSWQDRYPSDPPLTVGVNLSTGYFTHPNLVSEVSRALSETGLPPGSLILEMTEATLNEDPASAVTTLAALKKLGVRLAVDDFGTGFSSLANLKLFQLDTLKIGRSFISGLDDEDDRRLVAAVVSLAHALGLRVVAEGVETARQLMLLREMGCDGVQGSYFTGPLTHPAASAFLVADLYY